MSLPTEYRDWFVRNLHDALSGMAHPCNTHCPLCHLITSA